MKHFVVCFFIAACSFASPALASQLSLFVTVTPVDRGSVPLGAQRIPVSALHLQASCTGDVHISSLTVKHAGLGNASDILRVYVMQDGKRISRALSVSAKNSVMLRINTTVAACKTSDVGLFMDLSKTAEAGSEHRFDVLSLQADGSVVLQKGTSAPPLRVTPSSPEPSLQVDFRPVLTDVSYGDGRILARVLLTGTQADQRILSITFTNDGSAAKSDLQNLYLETADRTRLSKPVPQMDGKTVHIDLVPPLILGRGESKLLYLRGDVRASRTHTIEWTIDLPSDISTELAR
jgi:hypothetical protein